MTALPGAVPAVEPLES